MNAGDQAGKVTPEQVMTYARATGQPDHLEWAREDLERMAPELRDRVLRACIDQTDVLVDPIEAEPALQAAFEAARKAAEAEVGPPQGLGHCHRLWAAQQRVLRERYGITWYTPAEMNPNSCID